MVKNKTREGKRPELRTVNEKTFSIFNGNKTANSKPKKEYKGKHTPLISKEQRNKILRNLKTGISEDIL